MTKPILHFMFTGGLIAAAGTAAPRLVRAEPIQEARCTTDSLEPAEALQRIAWARRCGLLRNTGGPATWFSSARSLDLAALGSANPWAKDYRENTASHAYSGNSSNYEINYFYSWARYNMPAYNVAIETTGPTASYWSWSHPSERARPYYPTFETTPVANTGVQLIPLPSVFDDCNLYQWDKTAGTLTPWPGDIYVVAYCESSCYAPDQALRFSDGDVNIVAALKAKRDDLVTLSPDATLDDLATQTSKVYSYTAELRDAENVIYTLTTASGGSLSVTNEHPIITSFGRLVQAQKLVEGDELLKADGTPDPITRIEKTTRFGRVYNVKPASTVPVANILIAQGYLVGSARFQNDDIGYVNRILLFRGVPDDAMPK
jgi:hypothetical protein